MLRNAFLVHGKHRGRLRLLVGPFKRIAIDSGILVCILAAGAFGATRLALSRDSAHMQPVVSNSQPAARTRYTLNDGWKFTFSGQNKSEPAADDPAWTLVNLPHTWNAEDTLDDVPGYHRGIGWYRRSLRLDESLRGKRIFLYFE